MDLFSLSRSACHHALNVYFYFLSFESCDNFVDITGQGHFVPKRSMLYVFGDILMNTNPEPSKQYFGHFGKIFNHSTR